MPGSPPAQDRLCMREEKAAFCLSLKILQTQFEKILTQLAKETSLPARLALAQKAINFANNGSTGYYSSPLIEQVYLDLAHAHSVPLPMTFEENSFLHVMTECYATGGHTRVAERWIELSDPEQKHSLLFTKTSGTNITPRLETNIALKNGTVMFIPDSLSDREKGLLLREIASNYQYIILHVHMHDVIPLIAFGTEEFQRPVMLFNHADHRFWLGVSIADKVIELRTWGQQISKSKRGVLHSDILGIPVDANMFRKDFDTIALRQKLGFKTSQKIIITVGSFYKYKPLLSFDFLNIARHVLENTSDTCIVAIGPDYETLPAWKTLHDQFPERFLALGPKVPERMFEYLACADIALDSFPMSGGTALLDAVSVGCPVLSLDCPTGQSDYILKSEAYCANQDIFMKKLNTLLHSQTCRKNNTANVLQLLERSHHKDAWNHTLSAMYRSLVSHRVRQFETIKNNEFTDLDIYLYVESRHVKQKFFIPRLLEWNRIKICGIKQHEFIFFSKLRIVL